MLNSEEDLPQKTQEAHELSRLEAPTEYSLLKDSRIRFLFVGGSMTVLDFVLVNLLVALDFDTLSANSISTGISMVCSFFLNKRVTFSSQSKHYMREVILFFCFTLFGLWVIQNMVIQGLLMVLPFDWSDFLQLNSAKALATGVSMVWNYLAYRYVVFRP